MYLTRQAHEVFWPVGLKETDLGLQYGDRSDIVRGFEGDVAALVDVPIEETRREAEQAAGPKALNKLGIRYAEYGRYDRAEAVFRQAPARDAGYVTAEINLANVSS